jgi:RsiW-degrading membrane proteinase PrsW (M82 family)
MIASILHVAISILAMMVVVMLILLVVFLDENSNRSQFCFDIIIVLVIGMVLLRLVINGMGGN